MITRGKAVEVLAYTAGLIDGEGCITIHYVKPTAPGRNRRYIASVSVGSTDEALMRWMYQEYGGYIFPKSRTKPEYKPVWGWQASNLLARDFCEMLLPYLRTKKANAELLIRYWDGKKRYNHGGAQAKRGAPPEEIAWRDNIVQQIRVLNGQPQRLSEAESRTD